jgi:hypothetical protein
MAMEMETVPARVFAIAFANLFASTNSMPTL